MTVPRGTLQPVPIDAASRYWDAAAFRSYCLEHFGPAFRTKAAAAFRLHRSSLTKLADGTASPTLETYFRLLAIAGKPVGTWLQHIDRIA